MKRLAKKLHSQQGMTMLMALVYFLICLTVGAVILTAATASAAKAANRAQERQLYLDVSSASRLLRDALGGSRCTIVLTEEDGVETGCTVIGSGNLLTDEAEHIFRGGRVSRSFAVTPDHPQMGAVDVTLTMDSAYWATLRLDPQNGSGYGQTLIFRASAGSTTETTTQSVPDPEDPTKMVEIVYTTTTTVIQWDAGTIAKVVDAA